ncbi:hypothetical protein HC362_04390 [Streptomyces sp. 891-h]|nr:hypothetical protein HC362_04390 [Streptomyces sp. 891-h]
MGKHRRPGPPNQSSRTAPRVDPDDPLAPYTKRRRPPMDVYRRRSPLNGGAGHLRANEPRILEEWNGFTYQPVGMAPDLPSAQDWTNELQITEDPPT